MSGYREAQPDPSLLPCPFCGAPAEIQPWHGGKPTKKMVSCSNSEGRNRCRVGPDVTGETRIEAVRRWNKRALESALANALEDLLNHAFGLDVACEFCDARAPVCDAGPTGPIPHRAGCIREAAESALRRAGRLP